MIDKAAGFTLVELVMVIMILAIISTLAVSRFGSLRGDSARKVSIANQQAIGRAVETYLALNGDKGLDRLDSLIDEGTPGRPHATGFDFEATGSDRAVGGLYCGPVDLGATPREEIEKRNAGLSQELRDVLCLYQANAAEAKALRGLGLDYVMRHNTDAEGPPASKKGDDGAYPRVDDPLDPASTACLARWVTNGMVFAAITPVTERGREIYRDCGQELLATADRNHGSYDEERAKEEVKATGGPLLAFGLGDSCSIIGQSNGGLEAAPYSEVLHREFYRQYILLIRLRPTGTGSRMTAEFAGVLDPEGNTIRMARFPRSR